MSKKADHVELKELEGRRAAAEARAKSIKEELRSVRRRASDADNELFRVDKAIQDLKAKMERHDTPIIVSEHAILRYLERVTKIDMEEVKRKILPKDTQFQAVRLGNGSYPVGDYFVKIRNNVVVTVTTERGIK